MKKLLMDQATSFMEKFVQEIKEADPEKLDHFIKSAVILFEISTETLRTSPELRKGFAQVHSEFLKHPECRETIEQSVMAYQKYL